MVRTKWCIGDNDLIDSYTIRAKVFINEQGIPVELEMDNKDFKAQHVIIYNDEKAVATGRLSIDKVYTIGRVAVLKEERRNGYGDLVVRMLVRRAFDLGANKVMIHAQKKAVKFYETIGFTIIGEEYIEEGTGIPHINMIKNEDITSNC